MTRILLAVLISCSVSFAQFRNVKLAEVGVGQSTATASVAINPKDPKNLVVCAIGKVLYSLDGGETWSPSNPESSISFGGNETIVADSRGNFYLFHQAPADPATDGKTSGGLVFRKSTDEGRSWSDQEVITNEAAGFYGRYSAAAHPRKELIVVSWTQLGEGQDCQSSVFFSQSTSGGKKWSKPAALNQRKGDCSGGENTTRGAASMVSYDGKIFVAWTNQETVFLDRSYDGGKMWLQNDIGFISRGEGWSAEVPGLQKHDASPSFVLDYSITRTHGNIDLAYEETSESGDTDVWFMRSINNGDNWTQPERINHDDLARHQYLPRLAVDQSNGFIYVIYYDRRAYEDLQTDVYLAYSQDGREFKEKKISESAFVPVASETQAMINCIGIAASKGQVIPIWARIDNDKISVWTAVISHETLIK